MLSTVPDKSVEGGEAAGLTDAEFSAAALVPKWENGSMDFIENATLHVTSNGTMATFQDGTVKMFRGAAAKTMGRNMTINVGGVDNIAWP
jgi:hypothetical protein